MRITRLFVLLALAALLAPRAEASRTSVWERNPPSSLTAPSAEATTALAALAPAVRLDQGAAADAETAEPPLFDLGDVLLADTADANEERFNLGPLTLVDLNLLRGPPPSYPETRVGGFELLPPFRVGASPSLSLWPRQACGFSCREVASDSRYDPWGLMEEMASYAGMATAGYSQEEILQQAARDRAAAAAAGKAQLALIGGVNGAGWLSRTWAALKETWQIGVGLKAADWVRFNQQNLSNLGQDVLEAVNPGPSPSPVPLSGATRKGTKALVAPAERSLLREAGSETLADTWNRHPTDRGQFIENRLAETEYKDWFWVGKEDRGYFPLVDFQKDETLVSLKSVDTRGITWLERIQEHIDDLATRGASIDGQPARLVLDLRVQPGGASAAEPLIRYGRDQGIPVIVKEFP